MNGLTKRTPKWSGNNIRFWYERREVIPMRLIDALRNCSDLKSCEGCPYGFDVNACGAKMMRDAADAIEKLQAEVSDAKKPMRIWCTNNQVLEKYEKACAMLEKHEAENADFIVYTSEEAKDRVVRMKEKMKKTKDELIQRLCSHCDTTPEEKLKEGCCEGCPIIGEVKAVFDDDIHV